VPLPSVPADVGRIFRGPRPYTSEEQDRTAFYGRKADIDACRDQVRQQSFFILEGEGSIRLADGTHKIRKGDFISLPPGRDSAHQIINDSKAPLKYLAVSTMLSPEAVEYPDSQKIGVTAGTGGGRPPGPDSLRHFTRLKDAVDYWDGE